MKLNISAKTLGAVYAIGGGIAALFGLFGVLVIGLGSYVANVGVGGLVFLAVIGSVINVIGTIVAAWGGYRMYQEDREGKRLVIYGLALTVVGGLVSALGSFGGGLANWVVSALIAFVLYYLVIISRFELEPKVTLVRSLGSGAAAGAVAGLALGVGARLVMRAINVVDGIGPSGGPSLPVFTAGGTFVVVVVGVLAGATLGLPFSIAARTIRGGPLVAGLAYAFVLVALLGPGFFLAEAAAFADSAFRIGLFVTLFLFYGATLGVSYAWLGPRTTTPIAALCTLTALPGVFLVAGELSAAIPAMVLRYNWGALLFGVPWAVLVLVLGRMAIYAPGRRRTEAT